MGQAHIPKDVVLQPCGSRICRRPPAATTEVFLLPLIPKQQTSDSPPHTNCPIAAAPPVAAATKQWFRPTLELGIILNLFVFTMLMCAFVSVFLVSIQTPIAFRRLGASVNRLSKIVSEEVPGTLSSLKLSSMELNDLTQKLGNLRHIISGVRIGRKEESSTSSRSYLKNPAS
ncbi:uncharacterized protein LOC130966488 [Arachis stenosperma]|uniref:uncharacterized protein LOC130966488 n=1 Tax=Arachis stenosperma TaxID=217475 RepID=UPI0025ABD3AC|nr:uncharacterized protein LOC130966488 [Arachis stenosperma]